MMTSSTGTSNLVPRINNCIIVYVVLCSFVFGLWQLITHLVSYEATISVRMEMIHFETKKYCNVFVIPWQFEKMYLKLLYLMDAFAIEFRDARHQSRLTLYIVHIYTHTFIHSYIHICMHTWKHACTHTHTYYTVKHVDNNKIFRRLWNVFRLYIPSLYFATGTSFSFCSCKTCPIINRDKDVISIFKLKAIDNTAHWKDRQSALCYFMLHAYAYGF